MLRRYAQLHPRRAAFVSFIPAVCKTNRVPCDDRFDGVPARPDGTHYAGPAARMVCQLLARKLASILPAKTV